MNLNFQFDGNMSREVLESYRPASGDGYKSHFTTKRDNCVVKFTFRYMDYTVSAEIVE